MTEKYIDVKARLKSKKEVELSYTRLLNKANSISDILEIQEKLRYIREEIEAKQGQLKYLKNQVSYSTIELNLYEKTSETIYKNPYSNDISDAFSIGWKIIKGVFLFLIAIWPFYIFAAIVIYIIRFWRKRRKRK